MDDALGAQLKESGDDADRPLIDAAVAGDAGAFAALYDRHLGRVYSYVHYWTGNRQDAEDLTQQAFLQAWQAVSRYKRGVGSYAAWLLTIAHNLVMSLYRKRKDVQIGEMEPAAAARWANPEAATLAKHDRVAVQRAILRLKPEQQQVVTLRFLEHFDYADIAATLGKSEGNVRVIQHRALSELRHLLAEEVK